MIIGDLVPVPRRELPADHEEALIAKRTPRSMKMIFS